MLRGLPRDSALSREQDPEASMWTIEAELLASLIEVLDQTSWRAVMPHVKKGWKPPKPVEVPRPGHRKPKPPPMRMRRSNLKVQYVPKGGES